MSSVTLLHAEWLDKVWYDVAIEPPLQQLTGEEIVPATANQQDKARADIHASSQLPGQNRYHHTPSSSPAHDANRWMGWLSCNYYRSHNRCIAVKTLTSKKAL